MLSAVKPTIIMLILGKINQISVCLAVALRLKLIWKKIVINHLVNSPFKVEVVSVLHPEVQVTKKRKKNQGQEGFEPPTFGSGVRCSTVEPLTQQSDQGVNLGDFLGTHPQKLHYKHQSNCQCGGEGGREKGDPSTIACTVHNSSSNCRTIE